MHKYEKEINNLIKNNSQQFNKIYISSQIKFERILESIFKNNENFELIFINPHFNKNIYLSDTYTEFCKIEFIKSLNIKIKQKKELTEYILNTKKINGKFYNLKKFLKILIYLIFFIVSKFYFKRKSIKNEITLVDTYLTDDMFKSNKFINKYYINTNLIKENKKIFFLPVVLIKKGYFKKIKIIKSNNLNYIFPFDVLSIYEIISVIFFSKNFLKVRYPPKVMKYQYFFQSRIKNDLFNGQIIISRIIYLTMKKLKEKKVIIKKSINWYENQSKDKCFNYSVKTFHDASEVLSYKSIFSDNDYSIHLLPSNNEYKKKYYPDVIFTNSYGDLIHKKINKLMIPLKIGPLGRFKNIKFVNFKKNQKNDKNILVVLPIDYKISNNIINLIINFTKINKDYNFFFKLHPETSFYNKFYKIINENNNFFIIKNNITKLLTQFNTVITNGSSVAVEAYFHFKNIIISSYDEERINNPLKYYGYKKCYIANNVNDLKKVLIHIKTVKIKYIYNKKISLFYNKTISCNL